MPDDTPPPLPLGDVIKLLRDERIQTAIAIAFNESQLDDTDVIELRAALPAAADSLRQVERVLATMPADWDDDASDEELDMYRGRCAVFVRRLRAVVGTGTEGGKGDGR